MYNQNLYIPNYFCTFAVPFTRRSVSVQELATRNSALHWV